MAEQSDNPFKYTVGRPPTFTSPQEMWDKCAAYFESCKSKTGKYTPTIEGLTFALGFNSRQSLRDYAAKNEEFMDVVKKAKLFIKACYEKNLHGFAWAGSQFALRNLGKEDWQDEVIQNQNQTVTQVTIVEKKRDE